MIEFFQGHVSNNPFREDKGNINTEGRRVTCEIMNSVEGDMVVKDPSTGAEEDLEVKGMNVVMYTCPSLVLVQPDKEAWHSFGHSRHSASSRWPWGLAVGEGSNTDKQGNPVV